MHHTQLADCVGAYGGRPAACTAPRRSSAPAPPAPRSTLSVPKNTRENQQTSPQKNTKKNAQKAATTSYHEGAGQRDERLVRLLGGAALRDEQEQVDDSVNTQAICQSSSSHRKFQQGACALTSVAPGCTETGPSGWRRSVGWCAA